MTPREELPKAMGIAWMTVVIPGQTNSSCALDHLNFQIEDPMGLGRPSHRERIPAQTRNA